MLKKLFLLCLIALSICSTCFANDNLRVALVYGQYSAEISCDDEFTVEDLATGKVNTLPEGKYFLNVKEGKLTMGEHTFSNKIEINRFEGKSLPQINKRRYAGSLQAQVQGDRLLVNNIVNLELYLCSVLPSMTMPIWPDEAIKAQAIAVRSYAKYMMWQNADNAYDITSNDKELTYQGIGAEKVAISKFIKATTGQILVDGNGNPAQAVTTSSTGGKTASAKEVWGREVSYLQSVEDFDSDTEAILRVELEGGLTVRVSHFGLQPDEEENAVKTVIDNICENKCILMGDFNVTPDDPVLNPIRAKMKDTADFFDEPKLSFPSDEPDRKIDYIFVSKDINVVSADIPPTVVSDHRPHTATIEV